MKRLNKAAYLPVFLALFFAALYLALCPLISWPLYHALLFRPIRQTPNTVSDARVMREKYHVQMTEVTFPSANGSMLHGRYFAAPGARRVFLASQGCGGNIYHRLNIAQFLVQSGGSVLQYDYQGYGSSEGKPSLEGVCQDAAAAYDYLIREKHKSAHDIIAYGESFGTGVTGQLVTRRKVAGVILHSGFANLLRAGRDSFPWLKLYPDSFFPAQTLDSAAVFSGPHPPLLVMHGGKDNLVHLDNGMALYQRASQPKVLLNVARGGHTFFSYEVAIAVHDFMVKYELYR